MLNSMINAYEKFYGPGLIHFYATPIQSSVPRHMTHPVGESVIWPNLTFRRLGLALHGVLFTIFKNFTEILTGFSQSYSVKSF